MATILLVDDVQLFIELEKSFLEDAGYSVTTATSGEEALEKLAQVNPSLLLLDLYLPDIDGDEICRQLHNSDRWHSLPIIMVTAAGKDEDIRKCLDAGCADYLTKPVQKRLLIEKIERLLGSVKAQEEEPKAFPLKVRVRGGGRQFTATAREKREPQPVTEEKQNFRLSEENKSLLQRIQELEKENEEFAHRIITSEMVNNNLTNLYIASSRLHSVLDRSQVIEIINEVVINLVGAEKFVLALYDKDSQSYTFESGEGLAADEFPPIRPGTGLLGRIVVNGKHFFHEGPVTAGSDDLQQPLAAIPLTIDDTCIGLLAIYRLFTQKEKFEEVDFQLFRMMAEHAAIALCTATLYQTSERKRQTYKGFMDLLLK